VAATATFGVISACYTNIAMSTVATREEGILKRLRGTPLSPLAYLSARVLHAVAVGGLLVVITLAFGALVYDAVLPSGESLVQFVATFLVGSLTFAALALAISGVIPNAEAAPPIVNASILPLLFISGVFIPLGDDAPRWMTVIADVFPVKHFVDAMLNSFLELAFDWADVAVVAVWGVGGLLLATRTFSWEPRR
jgi:ABC-2 type transport system permease protein